MQALILRLYFRLGGAGPWQGFGGRPRVSSDRRPREGGVGPGSGVPSQWWLGLKFFIRNGAFWSISRVFTRSDAVTPSKKVQLKLMGTPGSDEGG